jgi:CheY-like chemotaxis protein
VNDTGIGIGIDDQARLFKPFFQVDHGRTRMHAGTGLGLAISLRNVQLHGGRIELKSTLGIGSRFTIILPVRATKTEVHTLVKLVSSKTKANERVGAITILNPKASGSLGALRVLVVDDISDNRRHLVDYLRYEGCLVDVAVDGIEAIQSVTENTPDIMLLDLQMPGLGGLDVMRCVRAMPATQRLPIITLSSLAMEIDQQRCKDVGSNAFLPKPYKMTELKERISELLALESSVAEE